MVRQNTLTNKLGTGSSALTPDEDVTSMWRRPDAVSNKEGGLAFKYDDYNELVMRTISCFFGEPTFYSKIDDTTGIIQAQNQEDELIRVTQRVAIEDPQFVLQLAAYARNELHLRTVPIVLYTEVAILHGLMKINNSKLDRETVARLIREYGPAILKRADEPTEAIAYYIAKNGSFLGNGGRYPQFARKGVVLSHALRKGIENAIFANFDHFTLDKYNRKNAAVKQKDVINLVHPDVKRNKFAYYNGGREYWNDVFKRVLDDTLPQSDTWEDRLMRWREYGYTSKKAAWEAIVPKMGYMAKLRNLRNLIEEKVEPTVFDSVLDTIKNPEQVRKSKQFPYRFYTAHRMLEQMPVPTGASKYVRSAQAALEDALDASLDNLPHWPGKTAVVADFSGSMTSRLSENSIVSLKEVAGLFMVMSAKMCDDVDAYIFADYTQQVNIHERSGVLDNVQRILGMYVGGSTEAWTVMADFINNNKFYDRCVLFSDMQCYNAGDINRISRSEGEDGGWSYHRWQVAPLWNRYKRLVNPNAYLYSIDLASYGTSILPIATHNLFLGGGFSDKILGFVPMYENDKESMVHKIRSIHPSDYTRKYTTQVRKFVPTSDDIINTEPTADVHTETGE